MQAGRWRSAVIPLVVLALVAAALRRGRRRRRRRRHRRRAIRRRPRRHGRDGGDAPRRDRRRAGGDGATLKVGYSAWPGWFPLAVAEKQGIFEQAGVDVELTYFADYIASLDALVAGSIDVNTQTLNDTIFGVAAGSRAADLR